MPDYAAEPEATPSLTQIRRERDQAIAELTTARLEGVALRFLALARKAGLRPDAENIAVRVASEHRLFALVETDQAGNVLGLRTAVQALVAIAPALFEPKEREFWPWLGADPSEPDAPVLTVATRYTLQRS